MMRVTITRTPLWEWVRGAAEQWRCRVPIGEILAQTRRRAGLTVAQVSEQVPPYRPRGRWLNWIVVLGLLAVVGLGVYARFSGPRRTAAVPPAAGKHAVTHRPARPGGPAPAPKLTHAAVTPALAPEPTGSAAATAPAPAAAAPAQTLAPAGAAEPGPGGGTVPPAHRATGGSHAAGGGRAAAPARRPAHHRPLAEPVPHQEPAPGRALPGHDHGPLDHHRRRAPEAHRAAGGSGQRPGPRRDAGPERHG
jgi:hypothetical protein